MNRRLSTILLVAFVVAAVASYLVYRIAGQQMHSPTGPTTSRIIVPAHDIGIGSIVKDTDIAAAEWVGAPPKGAITAKEAVLGRGVVSALYQGEPILESRLAAVGSGGGLGAIIKPGMRACAVRVDDVVGVAGFVIPGMRVDVLISGAGPGVAPTDGPRVKTLLQNIEVLSAGSNLQKDNEGKAVQVPVVNLLVTPEQAELLSLASTQTRIQLVLRNPLDTETPKTPSIAMASVFSEGPSPKPVKAVAKPVPVATPKAAPPRVLLVQVLNGGKHTEEKFVDSRQQQ